jgi:hypothetical protein
MLINVYTIYTGQSRLSAADYEYALFLVASATTAV